MKRGVLLLLLVFPIILFGQNWNENLPKKEGENPSYTFFEKQKAFNKYCEDNNVVEGKMVVNGEKVKVPGWKQFKRWEWNMEGQINPQTGKLPKKTAQQFYDEFKKGAKKNSITANWTGIGPSSSNGGYAGIGRINCIAFHPTDNNTYWVGAPAGGLWVTTNNGSDWTCLTDNNNVLGISDIIIPSNYASSKTIYIATGDRDGWDNNSIGVLKSTDDGATWNTTDINYTLAEGQMVTRMLIDPNDDNTILAATTEGVFKTTDGGTTWTEKLTSNSYIDMEYKPGDFNTLYGSTKYGKIYYSSNGGSSWSTGLNLSSGRRVEMAVTPDDPTIVYAVVAKSNGGLYSVQKSTDSGASFTQILAGSTKNLLGWAPDGQDFSWGGQGWYDLSIAISPTDKDIVLIGGVNTWGTINGGTAWTIKNHWSGYGTSAPTVHADKHNLVYRSNGDLFEVNDGGVYISSNDGVSWTDKSDGLVISQMYKLSVSQTDNDMTITGLQDNGSKMVNGNYWKDVTGGDGMECIIDYYDKAIQYSTYVNGKIYRTLNTWNNYTVISSNIQGQDQESGAWVTPYIMDPENHNTLYVGYENVWKTTDKGNSFTKISSMNTSDDLRSMAIAPSNTDVLYVADRTRLWKTDNGGSSWSIKTGSIPSSNGYITNIAIKHDDENTVWVTLGGYNTFAVYETTNGGDSWTNISTGLPQLPAYTVVQNKLIENEVHLYVGTELGIYFKEGTEDWVEYNTGLPNVKIGELEIYYDNNTPENSKLRAATYGRGLWESDLYFPPAVAPTVDFEANVTEITEGQTIAFIDLSSEKPTSWEWTFEGGTPATSTEQNPEVIFNAPGTYDVTLIATNDIGSTTLTKTDYITASVAVTPIAGFIANNTSVYAGQKIQLTDTSLNTPTSWEWTITGGTPATSSLQNPVVTFSAVGTYEITLVATNNAGSDTETKAGYIEVIETPTFPPVTNLNATLENTNNVNLTWELPPLDTILFESFEGTWPPANWSIKHSQTIDGTLEAPATNSITWEKIDENTFSGGPFTHSGTYAAGINYSATEFNWLVSPEFTAFKNSKLSFWMRYKNTSSYGTLFHIYVNDGGIWTQLLSFNESSPTNEMSSAIEIDLSAYNTKNIQIAFVHEYNDGYEVSVDDIFIGSKVDNYSIYRNEALVATINNGTQSSYNDVAVEVGHHDYYVITNYVNPTGSSVASNHDAIDIIAQAAADFTVWPSSGALPLDVTFNNKSDNASSYKWDFGDEGTSTEEKPTHTYTERGTYTVTLIAINDYNSDTITKEDIITVTLEAPVVDFSASPLSGTFPLEVTFTNATTNADSYLWDFGDGNTSTDENPVHTFTDAGNYTIKLTATNIDHEETETKTNYITVSYPAPTANFSAAPLTGVDPLVVTFTDESEYAQSWSWDFGDGETSNEQNPEHTYTKGTYTVTLEVSNNTGSDTETKESYITVDPNSIPENWSDKLSIYPNPADDYLTIDLKNANSEKVSFVLYDLQGKVISDDISENEISIQKRIDVSQLKAGSYLLKVEMGDEILMVKVAVK